MEFGEWLVKAPESLKRDPVWSFVAYPKALFLADLAGCRRDRLARQKPGF